MMKPGNGGYNISGDCEKGSGSRYCLGLCLARVREIWKIGWVVVRDFSHRTASLFPWRGNWLTSASLEHSSGPGGFSLHQAHRCILDRLLQCLAVLFGPTVLRVNIDRRVYAKVSTADKIAIAYHATVIAWDHVLFPASGLE